MSIFKQASKRTRGTIVTLFFVVGQAFGVGPAIGLTAAAEITAQYQHIDSFSSGSLTGYTQFSDYPAVWSADLSSDTLTASGGRQSKLVVNGLTAQDVELEVQLSASVDGGLVARFQDNNNYYLLAIRDGSGYPANLEIYKRSQGNYTSLGIAPISWPAGTQPSIKFVVRGSRLEAYLNGQVVLSLEDSSISTAGSVGLRQCTILNGGFDAAVYHEFKVRDLALPLPVLEAPVATPTAETSFSTELVMPLREDGSSVFQTGRVIPIKFRLITEEGTLGADVTPKLYFSRCRTIQWVGNLHP